MKKRGFTLIELLAVIVILAIILVIAVPTLTNVINENKRRVYESSVSGIIEATRNYVTTHPELVGDDDFTISINTLCTSKYLECPIVNPQTGNNFSGYVSVNYNNSTSSYDYQYVG